MYLFGRALGASLSERYANFLGFQLRHVFWKRGPSAKPFVYVDKTNEYYLRLLLLFPCPALAETWFGQPHVIEGDTVIVDQIRLRLVSMDAFETAQNCTRDSRDYACGFEATQALIKLIANRPVTCTGDERDRYQRPLVVCQIGDLDLGREMVRLGWAVSEPGSDYLRDQETAQAARSGAWAGTFQMPREWRRERR